MLRTAIIEFILFVTMFGIAGVKSQNTVFESHILNDTSLNGIVYYNANKTDYLINPVYSVQYDIFLTHYYNKMRIPDEHFYLQLNNDGSAAKDIIFHTDNIFNYKRNENTFQPYIYSAQNVKYFQNKKAYTSVTYSNALSGNQFFTVNFAKNLYRGLNLQTEYFVNYADGTFSNSQVMNQFFNVTLNYVSPTGRYRNNLAFAHNRAYIQENGGIENDSLFINHEYSKPGSFPVTLTQGWSKWKTSDYSFIQTYRLDKDASDKAEIFNKGALVHSLSFSRYARLYDDENKAIKDSLGTNIWRNSLFWTNDIYGKKGSFFIPVYAGLNYDVVNFNDSLFSNTYHLVSPEFKLGIHAFPFILMSDGAVILTDDDYKGGYQLNTEAFYFINRGGDLALFAGEKIQSRHPDYIFKHYLTENLSWDNNVKKTRTAMLYAGIYLGGKFYLEANYIDLKDFYFLDNALNVCHGDSKLYQVKFRNDFTAGKWRFKGVLTWQKAENEDVLHLPSFTVMQGFSYSFVWMKGKLKTSVGSDITYFSKYKADVYNTLTGVYCYQNDMKIGNYLFANAYVNINIDKFCMFLMIEHPYAGIINYSYFNSPLYPAEGFTFRYGFTWKLLD